MSDETSKSQDPEARRRRRRRRRGPRADDAPTADGAGGGRQDSAPRAQAAAEPAGERTGDPRRRRRRRRRPREEGETPAAAGAEGRETAGAEGRETAGAEGREAADGVGQAARSRSRRGRRRGGRAAGSAGAEARDGQSAAGEQAPDRPRRLQDRTAPSGSDDDGEDIDDIDGDDIDGDDDIEDRRRTRASDSDEDEGDEGDRDEDEGDEDEGDEDDEEDDGSERAAVAARAPGRDRGEHDRAGQLAVFVRSAEQRDGAKTASQPSDAGVGEDEPSGVWSKDEIARGAGDDDALPALPVPDRAHYEEPPDDDPDPATWVLDQSDEEPEDRALDRPVHNVVGIKFASAGRIYLYDAGDEHYARGEEVVVDTERGTRTGVVAVTAVRKVHTRGELKPVLRRPGAHDRRTAERNDERCREALQIARDIVRELALPMKVFRTEYGQSGKKATIYFTSEERVDFRDLVRDLSKSLRCRVEMRQTGVRDEAKQVGGIGSCGRELCCTTWLPEFVPVSIKMAKDQGLVLNPTKVSGQCGRLKCCLVYEQETYAALRKGLPKLGKRVITEEGDEGRVVEVDVLRQRVRVALAPGEFRVVEADQIKPMFPSQGPKTGRPPGERPPK